MRQELRAAWRRMRGVPVIGAVLRGADRALWARVILRSGLVDADFYAAQRGWSRTGDRRAVLDYVVSGFRQGLSVNPLFDELVAGRGLPEPDRVPAMYAYLVSDRRTVDVHPWWDARRHTPVARDAGGRAALDHVWDSRRDSRITLRVGDQEITVPVAQLRRWAIDAARAWRQGEVPPPADTHEDVLVRLLQRRDRDYVRRLTSALALSGEAAVVIGVVGCEPGQWLALDIASRIFPDLAWCRIGSGEAYAGAVEEASSSVSDRGGSLCVVGPRSDLSPSEIRRLLSRAREGLIVGPVELAADGTVAAVGAAGTGTAEMYRILGGHPQEDLVALGDEPLSVPALTGPTFAVSLADWRAGGGLGRRAGDRGGLEDLCARLRSRDAAFGCVVDLTVRSSAYARPSVFTQRPARATTVYADARDRAEQILRSAGFEVRGWRRSVPHLRWRRPADDALRWAVQVSSPPGPAGAVWGDTHFAQGLAEALRRCGQFVVVDNFDARERPSRYLDDVTLVVRGPYRIDPGGTGTRIEWIISHPDRITRAEVRSFDLVYAASHLWSEKASHRWGVPIQPLLECTDAQRFYPRGLARTDEIVFVGTARGIPRPSVVAPLAAGIPVRVYGPDWRTYIDPSAIVAESLPHEELSARYESASIVLNDQWPAMQREGFIAMRPFDVVAAGGRVISEYVDGIEQVFGDVVPVFRTSQELLDLLERDPEELFPDEAGLRAASARIREEHSFDARARGLVDAVRRHRGIGPSFSRR